MWNLINSDTALTFDDVSIIPRESDIASRQGDLSWSLGDFKFKIPIISSNMTTVTGQKMAMTMAAMGGLGIVHRFMSPEEQLKITYSIRFNHLTKSSPVCHSVGSARNDQDRIDFLIQNNAADILCIDMAHGNNTHHMRYTIRYIRNSGFKGPIIAGNVAGKGAADNLIEWGADMVKVGIGPGSVCTTRIKTGVGVPQLTAIGCNTYNPRFWDGPSAPVIADGGIRYPGDASKALVAGATSVMIGGMLAGTDCVPGWDNSEQILYHAGNASKSVKNEFTQDSSNTEGVTKMIERQPLGSTEAVITEICEGIRSTMSYVGASNLRELYERGQFNRVTANAVAENHPHLVGDLMG
jgi:IMP dehydrogenase